MFQPIWIPVDVYTPATVEADYMFRFHPALDGGTVATHAGRLAHITVPAGQTPASVLMATVADLYPLYSDVAPSETGMLRNGYGQIIGGFVA